MLTDLGGQRSRSQVKQNSSELMYIYEPAHEIMVPITQATSEGSGEPAHPCSLARTFTVHSHEVWK